MATIKNPNAILNGYEIEFPTKGYIRSNFNIDISNADENALGSPSFLPKPKSGTTFSKILDLVGFDVPVLVKSPCPESKGTVVILGQDALRDPKDPLLNGINTNTDIVVGLPYAIAFDRNYKQVAVYHTLIKNILESSYDVYLTDIWKSWTKGSQVKKDKWIDDSPYKDCLDKEFGDLQIDYIVLMGGVALKKYQTISHTNNIIDIPVTHLSPMANGKWKVILEDKTITEDNKIEHIREECKKQGLVFFIHYYIGKTEVEQINKDNYATRIK